MSKVIVRETIESDAKELIEYLNEVGGESDYLSFGANEFPLDIKAKEQFIKSLEPTNNVYLLAIVDDKIAGTLCSNIYDNPRFKHNANFDISVKQKYQGQGIGYQLLDKFINTMKQNDQIDNITFEVRADNKSAISLYEKLGFKQTGILPNNFKLNNVSYDVLIYSMDVRK